MGGESGDPGERTLGSVLGSEGVCLASEHCSSKSASMEEKMNSAMMTLSATVKGHEDVLCCMCDTGAAINMIDPSVVKKLGLVLRESDSLVSFLDGSTPRVSGTVDLPLLVGGTSPCELQFVCVALGGHCDLVLGRPALQLIKPEIDWDAYTATTSSQCNKGAAASLLPPTPVCEELSANQLEDLLSKDINHECLVAAVVSSPAVDEVDVSDFSCGLPTGSAAKQELAELLDDFSDVFQRPSGLPPRREGIDHRIDLNDPTPSYQVPYRSSWKEQEEVRSQISDMLDDGIIEPSSSPFCSPVVLVKKKDSTYRFCVDYRMLNKRTVQWRYPLPVVEDVLDRLVKGRIFSTIDLRSGYHQIRMAEGHEERTAFGCRWGQFQFRVMPFGVCNGPSTFQSAMHRLFQDLDFCDVYLDDTYHHCKQQFGGASETPCCCPWSPEK